MPHNAETGGAWAIYRWAGRSSRVGVSACSTHAARTKASRAHTPTPARQTSRGHRVSFLSTPRNVARLRRPTVAHVDFVELPLPRVDGLPDGAEATTDVPADKIPALWEASDGLAAPFSALLDAASAAGEKVDWVILDSLHCLAAASAADRKVPCVLIMPYLATACAHFGVPTPSDESKAGDHFPSAIARRFVSALERCKLVAVRSCVEFEPDSVPLLSEIFGKPVVPIGLLPPQVDAAAAAGDGDTTCMSWLDKQPPKSVVYVALGSEVHLTVEQVRELALGLELSGPPFLWALRKPHGGGGGIDDADVLPPGFEERTRRRGLVKTGWAPQIKILANAAVGAFLMHCGSSSCVEGLRFGHPLVMLPFFIDNIPNARYLEGVKRIGVQVPRDGKADGPFDRHGVAGAVRAAAVDEQSKRMFAANAKKLQEVVAGTACDERCIDAFIQQLRAYKD